MGKRGPAPKPPELQLLEGGRGHRPLNLDAVFRPEVGEPDVPRWLSKEGKKAWKRLAPELLHYNLLAKVDQMAFAMLCQTIGRMEIVERALAGRQALREADGEEAAQALVDTTKTGHQQQAALYTILNREQGKLNSLLAEFGLSPAQRARVSTAIRAQAKLFPVEGEGEQGASATQPLGGFSGFPDRDR